MIYLFCSLGYPIFRDSPDIYLLELHVVCSVASQISISQISIDLPTLAIRITFNIFYRSCQGYTDIGCLYASMTGLLFDVHPWVHPHSHRSFLFDFFLSARLLFYSLGKESLYFLVAPLKKRGATQHH